MTVWAVVGAIAVLVSLAFALLFWKLSSPARVRGVDPDWLRDFSVEAYRPMERLLSEEDIGFLKTQPGFRPKMAGNLRRARRRIFRAYLRNLSLDFGRLHHAARLALLYSPQDRPDLAVALFKQRIVFSTGLAAVHVHLLLHGLGLGTVDVRGLVGSLEELQVELQRLVTVPFSSSTAQA